MELIQQVCSLDLAKRLKDLGVKQESLFYSLPNGEIRYVFNFVGVESENRYSAFTVAELGEMLPRDTYTKREIVGNWACASTAIINSRPMPAQIAVTEADARAKMLISLLENHLVTL